MLKQRVLTAIVLLPLVAGLILFAPLWAVLGLLALGLGAAALEWAQLARLRSPAGRAAFVGLSVALAVAIWWVGSREGALGAIYGLSLAWWLIVLVMLFRRPALGRGGASLAGLLTLVPAWVAAADLYSDAARGGQWLLFVFVLVWAADVGAYFAGRAFGRHKLAPAVSPGKTWEGVAGGLLAVAAVLVAGAFWFHRPLLPLLVLGLAAAAVSVVGDLLESLVKRQAGQKDSGALLPGHGGVLDRVDSLLAALPVFVAGLRAFKGL